MRVGVGLHPGLLKVTKDPPKRSIVRHRKVTKKVGRNGDQTHTLQKAYEIAEKILK